MILKNLGALQNTKQPVIPSQCAHSLRISDTPNQRFGVSLMAWESVLLEPPQIKRFAAERKKEGANMEFPRLLRKPRKRNVASFF